MNGFARWLVGVPLGILALTAIIGLAVTNIHSGPSWRAIVHDENDRALLDVLLEDNRIYRVDLGTGSGRDRVDLAPNSVAHPDFQQTFLDDTTRPGCWTLRHHDAEITIMLHSIVIDGRTYAPGDTVQLPRAR